MFLPEMRYGTCHKTDPSLAPLAGDVVVTAGVHKLHEGEEVRVGEGAEKP